MAVIKCTFDEPFLFRKLHQEPISKKEIADCFKDNLIYNSMFNHKYFYYSLESTQWYLNAIYKDDYKIKRQTEFKNEIKKFTKYLDDISFFKQHETYNYFSLGCGDGKKDKKILEYITEKPNTEVNYIPIDFSYFLLRTAICMAESIQKKFKIIPYNLDFNDIGIECKEKITTYNYPLEGPKYPTIFTLFGNIIGNYSEDKLLSAISSIMKPDDYLLIGYRKLTSENENNLRFFLNDGDRDFLKPPLLKLDYNPKDLNEDTLIPGIKTYGVANNECPKFSEIDFSKVEGSKSIYYSLNNDIILSYTTRYKKDKLIEYCEKNYNFKQVKEFNDRPDIADKITVNGPDTKNNYGSILFQRCEDLNALTQAALENVLRFYESDNANGIKILKDDLEAGRIDDIAFLKALGKKDIKLDEFCKLLKDHIAKLNNDQ